MRRAVGVALVALLVVSAGCLSATGGLGTATAGDGDADGEAVGDGADDGSATGADSVDGPAGTVSFYVSDEPNDMDDFEHLNVTITEVRFHVVESADDAGTPTATATVTGGNATATAAGTATATATPTATETSTLTAEKMTDESEGEDGRWVVREVNATTVDLTRLRGDNATLVEEFALPAGEYNTVFLEVDGVDATLKTGESANVKLPSERLQLHTEFTVADGSETDFVYDISVHKAGNSGKYILKPVVSESGVGQPIERVDDEDESDDDSLAAAFVGPVERGENATVRVTNADGPVANATVSVEDGPTGTTNADGEFTFAVPADAEEIEVEVEAGGAEAELEHEFESDGDDGQGDGQGDGDGQNDGGGQGNGDGQGDG